MSLFATLKSIFSGKKHEHDMRKNPEKVVNKPLGFGLGDSIIASKDAHMLFKGSTVVIPPEEGDRIAAVGVISIGQGARMNRFYLENEDKMIQVNTDGGDESEFVAVIAYNYTFSKGISTEEELLQLMDGVGLPTYTYEGNTYKRLWGENIEMANMVALTEHVTKKGMSYNVELKSMLYSREIGLSDREEFLLISLEECEGENGEIESTVSFALGVTLFQSEVSQF